MKQLALGVRLRDDAVFESFFAGGNAEVLAALRGPGNFPIWLWGSHGSGKTHLLQAVCAASAGNVAAMPSTSLPTIEGSAAAVPHASRPAVRPAAAGPPAAYFRLDRQPGLPPEALLGFENCRLLCVDDVDAVAGNAAWERMLFRLFNEAAEQRTRLVFAAAAAPRQFDWVLDDWRSRAAACVVYQLRDLDEAGRVEVLRLRAAQRGLDLPPETSDYLLKRMPRDLGSLLEILDRLDEASLMAQRRLTVPFIRDALETLAGTKP